MTRKGTIPRGLRGPGRRAGRGWMAGEAPEQVGKEGKGETSRENNDHSIVFSKGTG